MAPKPRDTNPSGLGRAIINRKHKDARKQAESGLYVTDLEIASRLKSVTQEKDLDEFLNTAQLAGTEFTAERRNVKIIQQTAGSTQNPYLLSEQEEKKTLTKHREHRQKLRVPRRPPWTRSMTPLELEQQEKAAFLEWRRSLAQLQEEENIMFTPFERNLEVWRQLWRVLERSHLVVQIVDARNPLRFRCEDLEHYVKDVEGPEGEQGTGAGKRRSLLLINKADLLNRQQRIGWANYFDEQKIQYAFFSALDATALQQERRDALAAEEARNNAGSESDDDDPDFAHATEEDDEPESDDESDDTSSGSTSSGDGESSEGDSDDEDAYHSAEEDEEALEDEEPRTKVLSVLELEELFQRMAPDLSEFCDSSGKPPSRLVVGLVGYPNVGKSSTINSLLGEKKVSVSSTPGKTKHFQTINLSESIVLCDCPGLVFPQFATTKAELVCDGVLPIDQMKEYTAPTTLLVKRIPKEVLEQVYGLQIKTRSVEEGGNGEVTAENFLISYAIGRGYTRAGQGNPDEARSARYILKDYVNAKLLFCHPPPGISEWDFNKKTHEVALLGAAGKKKAPVTRVTKGADTFVASDPTQITIEGQAPVLGQGLKSRRIDSNFFEEGSNAVGRAFVAGKELSRPKDFPHQNAVANDGTPLGPKHARLASVLASQQDNFSDKKHHKKMKRGKQRSGKGYD